MCNSLGIWVLLDCVSWAYSSFQGVCNKLDWFPLCFPICMIVIRSTSLLQVLTLSQTMTVNFQLLSRFIQGLSFLLTLAGMAVAVAITDLSLPDIFACILAFVPTGWGILSVSSQV